MTALIHPTAPDSFGVLHPADEAEVAALVSAARAAGRRLRVRGSNHSVPAVVAGPNDVVMALDRLRHVHYDDATEEVTVGAGVRLGVDRADPRSPDGMALCPWLHARGRALPNLGGVIDQTVAGFFATGSCGGSLRTDAMASVVGLRLVDGEGQVRVLRRGREDDLLDAALVSLGAFGVVTELTLATVAAFDVAGTEVVLPDRGEGFDLLSDGSDGLVAVLEAHDHARVFWWPQRAVRRVVVWTADRVPLDHPAERRPYEPVRPTAGSTRLTQVAAGALLGGMVAWRGLGRRAGRRALTALERVARPIEGALYRAFVRDGPDGPSAFRGPWWEVLPHDQSIDERWLPATFTEAFVPLERAAEALRALDALFDADPSNAGHFAIELYASPPTRTWLHPSYGRASLRINVLWLKSAPEDPRDHFFPRIWDALAPFGARLHWAKVFPWDPAPLVVGRYPRLPDFLAHRAAFDPGGVFLTPWLAAAWGLTEARAPAPMPGRRTPAGSPQWPLLFALEPGALSLLDSADHLIEVERFVPGPAERVLPALFDGRPPFGAPGLHSLTWHSPIEDFSDAVYDEAFVWFTLRLRTVAYEPGRRLVLSVDRCSLPLARQMLQVADVRPAAGGCHVRWRVPMRLRRDTGFGAPALLPLFQRLFEVSADRLVARFEGAPGPEGVAWTREMR